MDILVVSDTHGYFEDTINLAKKINPDLIIHLGDNSSDMKEIGKALQIEVVGVRGNCDFYDITTPLEKVILLEDKKIFISHGHKYGIKQDVRNLYYRGLEVGADIVLFGHTHIPYEFNEDIIILNPGSASYPRGKSKKSLLFLNINKDERVRWEYIHI